MTRPGRPGLARGVEPSPNWRDGSDWGAAIDPPALFGNDQPIELEIGSGKGMFLLREGLRRPDVNFLGIEVVGKLAQLAAMRCHKLGAANVQLVTIDARKLFPLLPDRSLAGVHIYFPDPWWKRRHRKRRMVAPDVIAHVSRILHFGAELAVATDVQEYFEEMLRTIGRFEEFERLQDPSVPEGAHDLDFLTHFERKFRRSGKPTWRASYGLNRSAATESDIELETRR